MTDDDMDGRLRAAGERWRSTHADTATQPSADFEVGTAGPVPGRPRAGVVAAVAAAIVVLLAGGTVWLTTRPSHSTATTAAGTVTALDGPTWILRNVTSKAGVTTTAPTGVTLSFDAGKVDGTDGCNHFSGAATVTAGHIAFTDVAATAMGCLGGTVGKIQAAVGDALNGSGWTLYGGEKLVLAGKGGTTLVYTKAVEPTENPADLVSRWQLVETEHTVTSGDTASGSGSSSGSGGGSGGGYDSYLTITAAKFTISERCYVNAGTILIGKGTVTFSNVKPVSAIPCASLTPTEQHAEQTRNALVDSTLNGTAQWVIDSSGQLTITKGGDVLVYRIAPK